MPGTACSAPAELRAVPTPPRLSASFAQPQPQPPLPLLPAGDWRARRVVGIMGGRFIPRRTEERPTWTSLSRLRSQDSQQSLLEGHLRGVLEANKVHNLTRIDTWEDGLLLHVEDSLVGLPEIQDAPVGRYADLGTGGGFPGVPVAIMTGRETLLVDSVQKKMAAVQEIVDSLGLSASVSTYGGRIEDLAKEIAASIRGHLGARPERASVLAGVGGAAPARGRTAGVLQVTASRQRAGACAGAGGQARHAPGL